MVFPDMQINRLANLSRDGSEILGYQLQVTATKQEWETIGKWCDTLTLLQYADEQVRALHETIMEVIRG